MDLGILCFLIGISVVLGQSPNETVARVERTKLSSIPDLGSNSSLVINESKPPVGGNAKSLDQEFKEALNIVKNAIATNTDTQGGVVIGNRGSVIAKSDSVTTASNEQIAINKGDRSKISKSDSADIGQTNVVKDRYRSGLSNNNMTESLNGSLFENLPEPTPLIIEENVNGSISAHYKAANSSDMSERSTTNLTNISLVLAENKAGEATTQAADFSSTKPDISVTAIVMSAATSGETATASTSDLSFTSTYINTTEPSNATAADTPAARTAAVSSSEGPSMSQSDEPLQPTCRSLNCSNECLWGFQTDGIGCPSCKCKAYRCRSGRTVTEHNAKMCTPGETVCPKGHTCESTGPGSTGVCCLVPFSVSGVCPEARPGSRLLCLVQQRYQCRSDADCGSGRTCCPGTCGNTCRRLSQRRSRLLNIVPFLEL